MEAPAQDPEFGVRLAQIERRLEDTQALVARVYERQLPDAETIAQARAAADYDLAWSDPEPLISVRIATYRGAELLLERALPGLLSQGYPRWEALVVGDATDDDTASRIEGLGDPRITFENLPIRGPYPDDPGRRWYVAGIGPSNRALARAAGRWVAALDHDDEWDPDHLEVLLDTARRTGAEVVYGRLRIVDPDGVDVGSMGDWPPRRGDFGFLGSLVHGGLRHVRYDPSCRFAGEPGDWNLARRLWEGGARFAFVPRVVATHHFDAKPGALTGTDALISELRAWSKELLAAQEFWQEQSGRHEQEAATLGQMLEAERAEVSRLEARVRDLEEQLALVEARADRSKRWRH